MKPGMVHLSAITTDIDPRSSEAKLLTVTVAMLADQARRTLRPRTRATETLSSLMTLEDAFRSHLSTRNCSILNNRRIGY